MTNNYVFPINEIKISHTKMYSSFSVLFVNVKKMLCRPIPYFELGCSFVVRYHQEQPEEGSAQRR